MPEYDTKLRHDETSFPIKAQETRLAPPKRNYNASLQTRKSYDTLMEKLVIYLYKHICYSSSCYYRKQTTAAMAISKKTGYKHSYCFMKLPNHNYITQVYPDAMHTVKDCIENIYFLLIGKVNLDNIKSSETSMGRFYNTTRKRRRGKSATDHDNMRTHPYVLSSEEIKIADMRSKAIIMPNKDFNPGSIFIRSTGLKSHDWMEVNYI